MKKMIIFMLVMAFLVFSGTALAQNSSHFEAKIGADVLGELETDSIDDDTELGLTLIGEYKIPVTSQWTFGGGIAYQLDRSVDDYGNVDFNFIPIYGLAQYDLMNNPIYLIAKLGYNEMDIDNISSIDQDGGAYYGLGAGLTFGQYNQYVAEATYSVNNGEFEDLTGNTVDVEHSKLSIIVGRKF
ncbi:outer membrane beta-barrel protein [Halanaerobacter jeridensis]|uniref:Outer membrane protein beta-barrel domain-containing protein n=1 Tax=Halanaerobacter jeridensis TaxID=706427 RepID=A0A938XU57_9FIRM|nr:outer membrane beta-barrel protein [Halanaerobacter jeridensis]MBM7557598.1 hypothetical protein [Halanaerobacter jeridensis]